MEDDVVREGVDACIFCLDLAHIEGQAKAELLSKHFEPIAAALRNRGHNHQYLLALLAATNDPPLLVTLVTPSGLPQALAEIWWRAKRLGNVRTVIAPSSGSIKDIFLTLEHSGRAK